ncbi:MAG: hypothetical protein ACOC42_03005 [Halobacteriota archaeon]
MGATPTLTYGSFRGTIKRRNYATIGLAVVLVALGGVVWTSNQWAGLLYALVGITQLLIGLGLIYRLNARDDLTGAGNVTVQHSWGVTSIGIASAAIIPSEFFAVDQVWMALAVFVGLAWTVLGAFNLYWTVTSTEARLTV